MLKNYIKKKSKVALAIDIALLILLLLMLIPATRKSVTSFILRPTLFIHQPTVSKEKAVLNDEAYAWKLEAKNGKQVVLNSLSDKVIFINMWATWCPPCIAEMPDLQKLYNDYYEKVNFLFISHESKGDVLNFVNKKGYTFPVYTPLTEYPQMLETQTLPTTYIISKKGEIVINKTGVAKWNSKRIRDILDSLINQ